MKIKKTNSAKKWIIIVILIFLILAVVFSISLAWFTKESIDDNFDLNFANVSISLSGEQSEALEFKIINTKEEERSVLMPGDTINTKIRVTNIGDVQCYYLVNLSAKEINFNQDYYFNQSTLLTNEENKNLGILNVGEYHILNLEKLIDINFSEQGKKVNFICSVYAIQTKNITKENAYLELISLKD